MLGLGFDGDKINIAESAVDMFGCADSTFLCFVLHELRLGREHHVAWSAKMDSVTLLLRDWFLSLFVIHRDFKINRRGGELGYRESSDGKAEDANEASVERKLKY